MTDPPHQQRHGFTIIELLVVVAIIGLIMAMLLPALGASRRDAQLLQSLSNLKQIGTGTTAHASDNKGDLPIDAVPGGFATWSFGGKFCDPYWANQFGGSFDVAPNARPLNQYMVDGSIHPPVTGRLGSLGNARPANESERTPVELEVFKSPRDTASVQRKPFGTPVEGVSAYDDTGTSYFYNIRWYFQMRDQVQVDGRRIRLHEAFKRAQKRWSTETGFKTDRFVLYNDQLTELIGGEFYEGIEEAFDSDYGYENKSAMVFFDGHASFELLLNGDDSGEFYDLTFDQP